MFKKKIFSNIGVCSYNFSSWWFLLSSLLKVNKILIIPIKLVVLVTNHCSSHETTGWTKPCTSCLRCNGTCKILYEIEKYAYKFKLAISYEWNSILTRTMLYPDSLYTPTPPSLQRHSWYILIPPVLPWIHCFTQLFLFYFNSFYKLYTPAIPVG